MKENKSRWKVAQSYEKNWWDNRSNSLDLEFYERFADELKNFTKQDIKISCETRILEIGSGASGILTHLKDSNYRYAIDPLEAFYHKVNEFSVNRDKVVKYFSAKGENLPFKEDTFDLIIMDNVLDHCDIPFEVMNELRRVIKECGVIYFKQNTYHLWGKFVRFIMEKFLIDRGHPFTFSKRNLLKLINNSNLRIIKSERRGYFFSWKKEILSKSFKDKIKAVLFVTRDKVTYSINKRY